MSVVGKLSRRTFLHLSGLVTLGSMLSACGNTVATPQAAPTLAPETPVTNADDSLKRLMEGNQRYAANKSIDVNESASRRTDLVKGQAPFATIFSCVDSRVPPELVFDRGLGDLFTIRTAGHVIDKAVLGSLEFGVAELHIPLLMVLGHEKCGAVNATIGAVTKNAHAEADIQALVEGIRPAVEKVKGQPGDMLDNAVRANIELTVSKLRNSPVLAEAIEKKVLKIVGARYDLDTGVVEVTVQ